MLDFAGRAMPIIVRRHAQAKGYRLRYDAARAELRLTMPVRGRLRAALDWAATQQGWVRAQMEAAPDVVRLLPGAVVPVEGVEREIVWDRTAPRAPVLEAGRILLGGPEETVPSRLIRWLKARADHPPRQTLGQLRIDGCDPL